MMPSYAQSRWSAVFFIAYISTVLYFLMNLVLSVDIYCSKRLIYHFLNLFLAFGCCLCFIFQHGEGKISTDVIAPAQSGPACVQTSIEPKSSFWNYSSSLPWTASSCRSLSMYVRLNYFL